MLAVPLGNVRFVSGFVQKKLLGRLQDTVNRLVEFEDTQAATYLLRVSFSIVRAVHFMRTTPLEQWREQASKFDGMSLGLRKVVQHADFAYHASWHEAQNVAKEKWALPIFLPNTFQNKMPLLSLTKRCTLI